MTYIEHDRQNHQPGVEAHQGSIFHQAILLDQPLLHDLQEIPIQAGVNEAD